MRQDQDSTNSEVDDKQKSLDSLDPPGQTMAKLDDGVVETMAKRVGQLIGYLLAHSTFAFGFCAAGCAPILYWVDPRLGLVAFAMGAGATAGKIGKLLDARLRG